ncbi:MAG: EamA family transporter [Streptosporangiales bacterium]|nr:EamA family transporter [Streptosporangiales bacterium]
MGHADAPAVNRAETLRGAVGAASAMTFVGSLAAVSGLLTQYPVLGGQAVRYATGALILFAVMRVRRLPAIRLTARELGLLVLLAATGLAAFNVCILLALRTVSPAMVGTIIGCTPIVLAVTGPLLAHRRPAARVLAASVVVALGAGVAQGLGDGSLAGFLLALGALAGEAAFSLLAVPLLPRLGPLRVSAYAAALAVPLLFAAGIVVDGRGVLRLPSPAEFGALAYQAVVVTAVAFVLWYGSIPRLGADRAGLFAGLVPISAAACSLLLGTGRPTVADLLGAVLVGTGVAAGMAPGRRAREARSEPAAQP